MLKTSSLVRQLLIYILLIIGLISTLLSGCQTSSTPANPTTSYYPSTLHSTGRPVISSPTLPVETVVQVIPRTTIIPTDNKQPGCIEKVGHLEKKQFDSAIIGKTQRVNIYLPACYDPQIAGGYPVLFMLHGQGQDENFWVEAGIVEMCDRLINSKDASPFLVVMPYEEYSLVDILQSDFDEMFIEELIPWVEANLAVDRDNRLRAIGGNSRGAYWAFRLAFKYQGQFGAVGVHSIPFFGEPNALRLWVADIPREDLPLLYLDIGEHDRYLNDAVMFQALLERNEIPHEWHLNEGEHDAAYWQENLYGYLQWHAQAWHAALSR